MAKKKILFATGNERKFKEAQLGLGLLDIDVEQVKVDLDEIQSTDPIKISTDKALKAFELIKKPLVVTDTYWKIYALNGFPGAYMKEINGWFTSEDFLDLMKNKEDRRVSFTESVIFTDGKETKIFSKEYMGNIVRELRGTGNAIEKIAEFEGKTLGERHQEGGFSHKPEEYIWYEFGKWFKVKNN